MVRLAFRQMRYDAPFLRAWRQKFGVTRGMGMAGQEAKARVNRLETSPAVMLVVSGATNGVVFLLAAILFQVIQHQSLLAQLKHLPQPFLNLGVGMGLGMVGALVILAAYRYCKWFATSADTVVGIFQKVPVWFLVVASLLAGVAEESLFRGALQPLLGLVGAALVFGLLHTNLRWDLRAYGLTAFVIGLLFGYGYVRTGVLWTPIAGHTVYNLLITWSISRRVIGPARQH